MGTDGIDRVAPTRRPAGDPVQRGVGWHDLGFLHWRVDPELLRPHIPAPLELDTFDGDSYLGLVPFRMTGVRPRWAPPMPGTNAFPETNVRSYVHLGGRDPGVWFFSLDAASLWAVLAARTLWRLPYFHAEMSVEDSGSLRYASRRHRGAGRTRVELTPEGAASSAEVGTLEHFLAERYLLYTRGRGGALLRGAVHHAPYPLQSARLDDFDETLIAAVGLTRPDAPPDVVHFARRVEVELFPLERVGST